MSQFDRRKFFKQAIATTAGAAVAGGLANHLTSESLSAQDKVDLKSIGKTPHTKFAVNCEMWWTKLPFMERVKKTAEYGFPAIEFWPYENKDLDALAKLTKDLGIAIAQFTVWGFEPGMNNPKNEDAVIEKIKEGCKVAHKLDCKLMTVVAGNVQKGMTQDEMLAQVIKTLKRAAPILEENQVTAILEPMNGRVDHPGHCLYGSTDALRICREVDSKYVKINWDLYHMQITEGDLCGRMKDGIDQIGYLQLADHPGRHEPGTGEVHYNRVLKQAIDLGYTGYVGLECTPRDSEHDAALRVAAADIW